MAQDSTSTSAAAGPPRPAGAGNEAHHEADHGDGAHEIAGFRVGVNPIPFSVVLVFLFIFVVAILSWIPTYGF